MVHREPTMENILKLMHINKTFKGFAVSLKIDCIKGFTRAGSAGKV